MPVQRQAQRETVAVGGERVACPGYRGPAEVKRVTRMVEHDLDHVRIERLVGIVDLMTRRGDRGVRVRAELVGNFTYQRRLEQWLVSLYVDDHGLVVEPELKRGPRHPIRAGRMVA